MVAPAAGDGIPPAPDRPVVPCVGAVVHDTAGRLLLIRRGHDPHRGSWSLPGGRVESGESVAEAVEREVLEETGLVVRAGATVGRVLIPAGAVTYDVVDLACALDPADQRPVAGDDADDAVFPDPLQLGGCAAPPRPGGG